MKKIEVDTHGRKAMGIYFPGSLRDSTTRLQTSRNFRFKTLPEGVLGS